MQAFRREINESRLYDPSVMATYSVDDYAELFNTEVTRVLDRCAPLRTTTRRSGAHDRHSLSDEARDAKRRCRQLERRYRRTGSVAD